MRFRGVLVKSLDTQHDRDGRFIDPVGLNYEDEVHVIWRGFGYQVPDDIVGWGRISRAEDGSLVVEGELSAFEPTRRQLAPAVSVDRLESWDTREVVADCRLMSIAITDRHTDPTQPWIEVFE